MSEIIEITVENSSLRLIDVSGEAGMKDWFIAELFYRVLRGAGYNDEYIGSVARKLQECYLEIPEEVREEETEPEE